MDWLNPSTNARYYSRILFMKYQIVSFVLLRGDVGWWLVGHSIGFYIFLNFDNILRACKPDGHFLSLKANLSPR